MDRAAQFADGAYVARVAGRGEGSSQQTMTRPKLPWFILYFCVAAALSTYLPRFHAAFAALNNLGKQGLSATLFLIGTSLSRKTLQQVGARPLVQGVLLWIVVGTLSLAAIYWRVISI